MKILINEKTKDQMTENLIVFDDYVFQRLWFTGHWYVIRDDKIIDHGQYINDLKEKYNIKD